ncbi:MAG TPA: class D sortase, partial [Syntrophomonas sp.]|nr:class D sortase [Syntrophomonas sp.]
KQPWGKRPLGTVHISIQYRNAEAKRQPWGKRPLGTVLSLGFMVLGIGCITWAMFAMWTQSDYSADAARSRYSIHTRLAAAAQVSATTPVMPATAKALYPVDPVEGDYIGSLTIPVLKMELPLFQGTGAKTLKKGVGHFIQSVLPGENDNCVVSGHRETVFRQLGKLKMGDQLIVQTSVGTFIYEVNGMRIVHADDRTVIVPTDHGVLTMTTCYPFNTPGYHPDRYIVSAALINSK